MTLADSSLRMVINKGRFMPRNYSEDRSSEENFNINDKYSVTGESEFSRESTIPFDEDDVLSERHYTFTPLESHGRQYSRSREPESEPFERQGFRGRGPKGYRRSDENIREDVSEALYRSSEVDASEIEVEVKAGQVTLKGFTQDRAQKKAAERAVENLSGVEDVRNEIRVKRQDSQDDDYKTRYGLTNNITGLN
jgi:hypothetical protein